jgi:hypothetical protein
MNARQKIGGPWVSCIADILFENREGPADEAQLPRTWDRYSWQRVEKSPFHRKPCPGPFYCTFQSQMALGNSPARAAVYSFSSALKLVKSNRSFYKISFIAFRTILLFSKFDVANLRTFFSSRS